MGTFYAFGRRDYCVSYNVPQNVKDILCERTTIPLEDEWFDVDPVSLVEQEIFMKERKNWSEERTRQIILEAFEEAKKKPERYLKKFRTMFPSHRLMKSKYPVEKEDFQEVVKTLGDHQADWIEQALEWAQRIYNNSIIGWKVVCNKRDAAKFHRAVIWKDGTIKFIGGSRENYSQEGFAFPSAIRDHTGWMFTNVNPLIVSYDFSIMNEKENIEKVTYELNGKKISIPKIEVETSFECLSDQKSVYPVENEWFEVVPSAIDKNFFKVKKKLSRGTVDEDLFRWIVNAIEELEKNPEKYNKPYKTLIPSKVWREVTGENCEKIATEIGDHLGDWVELGLQWAYGIMNNNYNYYFLTHYYDSSTWFRVIRYDYRLWRVGGSRYRPGREKYVFHRDNSCEPGKNYEFYESVPFIVSYDD